MQLQKTLVFFTNFSCFICAKFSELSASGSLIVFVLTIFSNQRVRAFADSSMAKCWAISRMVTSEIPSVAELIMLKCVLFMFSFVIC